MQVISGLLPETWGYFCMKNIISTTRNCHCHESPHFILFALLKVHPRFFPRLVRGPSKLMGPGAPPRLTSPLSGPLIAIRRVYCTFNCLSRLKELTIYLFSTYVSTNIVNITITENITNIFTFKIYGK